MLVALVKEKAETRYLAVSIIGILLLRTRLPGAQMLAAEKLLLQLQAVHPLIALLTAKRNGDGLAGVKGVLMA